MLAQHCKLQQVMHKYLIFPRRCPYQMHRPLEQNNLITLSNVPPRMERGSQMLPTLPSTGQMHAFHSIFKAHKWGILCPDFNNSTFLIQNLPSSLRITIPTHKNLDLPAHATELKNIHLTGLVLPIISPSSQALEILGHLAALTLAPTQLLIISHQNFTTLKDAFIQALYRWFDMGNIRFLDHEWLLVLRRRAHNLDQFHEDDFIEAMRPFSDNI